MKIILDTEKDAALVQLIVDALAGKAPEVAPKAEAKAKAAPKAEKKTEAKAPPAEEKVEEKAAPKETGVPKEEHDARYVRVLAALQKFPDKAEAKALVHKVGGSFAEVAAVPEKLIELEKRVNAAVKAAEADKATAAPEEDF